MMSVSKMVLPSVEEVFAGQDTPRDEKAETKLQREVPWLLEDDALSLVLAKESAELERFLYYLIMTIGTSRPIRLFLRMKDRGEILRGLMRSYIGKPASELSRTSSDEGQKGDMANLYQKAKEWILSLDLMIEDLDFGTIEDLMEFHPPLTEEMGGSIVIFDSLVALTSKATTKWALSRAIIGARLKEWMELSEGPVILFERLITNLEPGDLEDGIYDYLDGSLVIRAGERHYVNGNVYHERDIHYKYKKVGGAFRLFMDWQEDRYIDELPEEIPVDPSPDDDGMPF